MPPFFSSCFRLIRKYPDQLLAGTLEGDVYEIDNRDSEFVDVSREVEGERSREKGVLTISKIHTKLHLIHEEHLVQTCPMPSIHASIISIKPFRSYPTLPYPPS